jgi:Fe-S cluster biogenesis protein NfuA
VESLLLLHGIHPQGVAERVERALEKVRPQLQSHKGDVALVALEGDHLKLQLTGSCHGCPASQATFRNLIQAAVEELAPEVEKIDLVGVVEALHS